MHVNQLSLNVFGYDAENRSTDCSKILVDDEVSEIKNPTSILKKRTSDAETTAKKKPANSLTLGNKR